jgi:GNAT superfamily N-acetyltransferase
MQQGAGVGSWLLGRIEEVARLSGARGMSLYPAAMMDHLVRLYRRHGFEIVRRGPPDHGLDAHTRVHMVKSF